MDDVSMRECRREVNSVGKVQNSCCYGLVSKDDQITHHQTSYQTMFCLVFLTDGIKVVEVTYGGILFFEVNIFTS